MNVGNSVYMFHADLDKGNTYKSNESNDKTSGDSNTKGGGSSTVLMMGNHNKTPMNVHEKISYLNHKNMRTIFMIGNFSTNLMAGKQLFDLSSWILDSGASDQFTNNFDLFTHEEVTETYAVVGQAVGFLVCTHIGNIRIRLSNGTDLVLKNVVYCKEFSRNLLSLHMLK